MMGGGGEAGNLLATVHFDLLLRGFLTPLLIPKKTRLKPINRVKLAYFFFGSAFAIDCKANSSDCIVTVVRFFFRAM